MKYMIISVLAAAVVAAGALLWSPDSTAAQAPAGATSQKTFVLVHGAFSDEHAWDEVKPALEASGAKVVTVRLPAHGADTTDPKSVSLKTYTDAVEDVVREQEGPVILVGHSMAGMVISQVAQNMPEKIDKLVYVAAYVPQNGQSMQDLVSKDVGNMIAKNLEYAKDFSTATLKPEAIAAAVCADCMEQVQVKLAQSLQAEPLRPFNEKVTLTDDKFGSVKKAYIFTTQDKAVTYELQKHMVVANGAIAETYSFDTSHLPFVVQPQKFAETLLQV